MFIDSLTTKAVAVGLLLAALTAGFLTYRHSLIKQGRQEAAAEYAPKLAAANAAVAEWKLAADNYSGMVSTLSNKIAELSQQLDAINGDNAAWAQRVKDAELKANVATAKRRDAETALAKKLAELQLPKEECDALRTLIDAARADGM